MKANTLTPNAKKFHEGGIVLHMTDEDFESWHRHCETEEQKANASFEKESKRALRSAKHEVRTHRPFNFKSHSQ